MATLSTATTTSQANAKPHIKLGVVMDDITSIHYEKDSTLAMLWAAAEQGWDLFYMEQGDLFLDQGAPFANMAPLQVFRDKNHYYEKGEPSRQALDSLDVVLMRKDPPFDTNFVYTTYILEAAEQRGCLIVNKPQSLRDCNEKIFATQFPQCCPPVLVSSDPIEIRQFQAKYGDIILKPLDGMGGTSIFRIKPEDTNLGVIIETLTDHGQPLMAQGYLPEIKEGDKRILVIDGEAIPYCLARLPSQGEHRGNLAAGGSGRAQPLSDRDRWIVAQIAPKLREKGLIFVGLDVIGDYLTEINVTSPTCIREIDKAYDTNIAEQLMSVIAQRLSGQGRVP